MQAISLVEKGWAGARRVSIRLVREGGSVRHVVRGRLDAELLNSLTPYARMTIRGVSPGWYRTVAWFELARALPGGLSLVIVDNENAAVWVSRCFPMMRERILVVQEGPDGTPEITRRGVAVPA